MPGARFNEANMLIHLWKRWSQTLEKVEPNVGKGGAKRWKMWSQMLEKVEPNVGKGGAKCWKGGAKCWKRWSQTLNYFCFTFI